MVGDDEVKVRSERARAIGLFRYQLIREAADAAHSTKERFGERFSQQAQEKTAKLVAGIVLRDAQPVSAGHELV